MKLISALVLAASVAACGSPPKKRASEASREPKMTGVTSYDTFFGEVADVTSQAEKAGAELADASKPLSDAIGPQASGAKPPEIVRAEAKKLQTSGTLLHLDLVPETKVVTSAKPDAQAEKLLAAAEKTAKGTLAIKRRADEILLRIADLQKRRADLVESAKTSFPDEGARSGVLRDLAASEGVLEAARQLGEKHAGAASKLVLDLAMALETGAGSGAVASKKPGKPGGGGKPGGTGAAVQAKPKGDDFDK